MAQSTQPRTELELLYILLSKLNHLTSGLCPLLYTLYMNRVISYDERFILKDIINRYKPRNATSNTFWFGYGFISPRLELLELMILDQIKYTLLPSPLDHIGQ